MSKRPTFPFLAALCLAICSIASASAASERVLENEKIRLTLQQERAIISHLEAKRGSGNWLTAKNPQKPGVYAHFLCFDRWGAPSKEEAQRGIPFHGEAPRITWQWLPGNDLEANLQVTLPISQLEATRLIKLSPESSAFAVTNVFKNPTPIERVYNAVEHVTLSPLGRAPETWLATNATRGMLQSGRTRVPDSDFEWPYAYYEDRIWDLRQEISSRNRVLVAMIFPDDAEWGWVTLQNLNTREVIGYVWPVADYPWLMQYTKYVDGQTVVRAIEPGTTGLHQPMPQLKEQGSLYDRVLFQTLQPGEERTHRMWGFVIKLPDGTDEVTHVAVDPAGIHVEFAQGDPQFLPMKIEYSFLNN